MLLFILSVLCVSDASWYKTDELSVGRLMSFAGHEQYAMAQYMGRSPGSFEVVIFDMEKGMGKPIKDGRLRVMRASSFAYDGHFVLIDKTSKSAPKAHFVSPRDGYQRTERLNEYSGWQSNFMFHGIGFAKDQNLLILYYAAEDTSVFRVGELHFEKRAITQQRSIPLNLNTHDLVILNGQAIRAIRETAAVNLIDAIGRVGTKVFPAQDPVPVTKSAFGSKKGYKNLIFGSHTQPGLIQFEYSDYYTEGTEPTESGIYSAITIGANHKAEIRDRLTIHTHNGKGLYFVLDGKYFEFAEL